MRTISQRELRNDNAVVIRAVEQGESFVVTRRGVPVARLAPYDAEEELRCLRRASRRPVYSDLPRLAADQATAGVLADLRDER